MSDELLHDLTDEIKVTLDEKAVKRKTYMRDFMFNPLPGKF